MEQVDTASTSNQSDFDKYLATLRRIDLPTNLELYTDGTRYEYGAFEKFKTRWSDKPFGVLYEMNDKVVTVDLVVASSLVPVFVVYDKQGNILDTLYGLEKTDTDTDFETVEWLYIDQDEIRVYSRTTKWKLNEDKTARVSGTETMTGDTVIYVIDDNGKFITRN